MHVLRRLWNDPHERQILYGVLVALVLLCVVGIRIQLPAFLAGTLPGVILTSEALYSITVSLLAGIVAAYLFYLLVDYLPRIKQEASIILLLNTLIASVLDAYNRTRIYGHETPLSSIPLDTLKDDWLAQEVSNIKTGDAHFLSLKFATQTAYTTYDDFRGVLTLASQLSPDHAYQWLGITQKIRLLAENYGTQPPADDKIVIRIDTKDTDVRQSDLYQYKGTLSLRVMEVLEQTQRWLAFTRQS